MYSINCNHWLKSPASQRGRDFGIILKCLQEEGYGIEWRVINAADYGCVQRRRRTFIFAFKNTTKQYERMTSCFSADTKDGRVWLMQEGFGQNDYVETERPLVIVTAPGPGSGKMAVCLFES